MANRTIEMICPSCEAELELDAGFAGGVCRCTGCATLMLVPRVSGKRAEQLFRPETPGSAKHHQRSSRSHASPDASSLPGRYTTASGAVLELSPSTEVPTAMRRRRGVRAATVALFGFIMVVLLGVCASAIYVVTRPPSQSPLALESFEFNPRVNPLRITEPNVLGLPLSARTAVLLDLSGMSPSSWEALRPMLSDAFNRSSRSAQLGLVVYDASGLRMPWGDQPARLGTQDEQAVRRLLAGLQPMPDAASVPVLSQSATMIADMNPARVLLITSRSVRDEEASPFAAKLGQVPVDVVVIDEDSNALDRLTRGHEGIYRTLDSDIDLRRWVEQMQR